MRRRSFDVMAGVVTAIPSLIAGPLILYAINGEFWNTTGLLSFLPYPRIIAGIVGGVLILIALLYSGRFRNAEIAGAVIGLAAAVGVFALDIVPWIGYATYGHAPCNRAGVPCSLLAPPSTDALVRLAIFIGVVYTVAGVALASLLAAMRRRYA